MYMYGFGNLFLLEAEKNGLERREKWPKQIREDR